MFEKYEKMELLPPGTYYGILTDVHIESQPGYDDPTVMTMRAKFSYQTTTLLRETDKNAMIYDWTGVRYGNPKATLTKRLDQMFPRLTPEQRADIEPQQMVGRRFEIVLVHQMTVKGEAKHKVVSLRPIKELPPPTYLEIEEEEETEENVGEIDATDPFADQKQA